MKRSGKAQTSVRGRYRSLSIECLETRKLLAVDIELLKDIQPLDVSSSYPRDFTAVGEWTYFTAETPTTGRELWKTDGTEAGTSIVRDIHVGVESSNPSNLINYNGWLYFYASSSTGNNQLWRSDGTADGTSIAIDFQTVLTTNLPNTPRAIEVSNNILFAVGSVNVSNFGLWRTDGSATGTFVVSPSQDFFFHKNSTNLRDVNGTLFFSAYTFRHGAELWKSDGSVAGTVVVRDIESQSASSNPADFQQFDGMLYFTAQTSLAGRELWRSDGTSSGTTIVKDITPGSGSSFQQGVAIGSIIANDSLYFRANDGVHGTELWKSDGTASGTNLVTDLAAGSASSQPYLMTAVGDQVYFVTNNGISGRKVWRTNGFQSGTFQVMDFSRSVNVVGPYELIAYEDAVYFAVSQVPSQFNSNGFSLWRSDGTNAGTFPIKEFKTTGPIGLTVVNNLIYFSSNDPAKPNQELNSESVELWKSDGTVEGTKIVKDIVKATHGSNPLEFVELNDLLLFSASNSIWSSDGTETGTRQLTISSGMGGPGISNLTAAANVAYFWSFRSPSSLWKTDGTPQGTMQVKQILNSTATRHKFHILDDKVLFFVTSNGSQDITLWTSDGTSDGTLPLKGTFKTVQTWLVANGLMYFVANDGLHGDELWRTDGTVSGTFMIKDIQRGISPGQVGNLVNVNGVVYFSASDGDRSLWRTDGTESGTFVVQKGLNVTGINVVQDSLWLGVSHNLWIHDIPTGKSTFVKELDNSVDVRWASSCMLHQSSLRILP